MLTGCFDNAEGHYWPKIQETPRNYWLHSGQMALQKHHESLLSVGHARDLRPKVEAVPSPAPVFQVLASIADQKTDSNGLNLHLTSCGRDGKATGNVGNIFNDVALA